MKIKNIIVALLLCCASALHAQEISVKSFERIDNDMAARVAKVYDVNTQLCALIKVETSAQGFHFQGMIEKTEQKVGEIFVFVSPGIRFITIKHQQLGILRNYEFPQSIESGVVYVMKLVHGKLISTVEDVQTENFLVIRCNTPTDAKIFINDEYVGKGEASKFLSIYDEHTYRVEAPLYHTEEGKVKLSADATTEKNITLKPAFGYIKINTKPQGATVEINGEVYSELTPFTTKKLASGTYTIQAFKEMYKQATAQAVVKDGETTTVTISMEANFAEVTFEAQDNDASIYVDNSYKGEGRWSGPLAIGPHKVEVKKDKHRTYTKNITVSQAQPLNETIPALQPICGKLKITSTPLGAAITIDDKNYGATPKVIQNLLIGNHTVTLTKDGYSSATKQIHIEEGKTAEYDITLQEGNIVTINTDKFGDALYVDGQYVGTSPMETRLTFGKHEIEAERDGKRVSKQITVTEGSKQTITLAFVQEINGHKYVDLGLSVKWATCNVGASQPHEYGDYYAWGETSTKSSYTTDNSKTYKKRRMGDISGNASYDAARANWGGSWRLPTKREMEELVNKCTWTWTSQSGVNGYKVTGPNGNSIFLPAAGYCYGTSRNRVGEYGNYWSSTPYEGNDYYAYYLFFSSGGHRVDWSGRYSGRTVRPVSD